MNRPILAVTMGDPAGIGPEIAVRALLKKEVTDICRPVLIGDAGVMRRAARVMGEAESVIRPVGAVAEADFAPGRIQVLDIPLIDPADFAFGRVSAACGNAAFVCVRKAIELAMNHEVDGTVTNPLNKEALNLAGYHFAGHTEIYAHFTGTEKYTMMLAYGALRVVHVSTHVSLAEACRRVTKDRVYQVIGIADRACRALGVENPRVAVAGLNPHSGEGGLFGREEIDEIRPAVERALAEGLNVEGPIPADTVFSKANGGMYDIVVAMYHDQGHIPLKLNGFVYRDGKWENVSGVNITLGLPIIRTSVDHGTAFDLAGKGLASDASLVDAIGYAARLAARGSRL